MNTNRNGKIARLPRHIRDQLNQRLDDGHEAKQLAPWLNSLPEVQAVLAALFDSQPINEVNLTHWKQGGFADWQKAQDKSSRLDRLPEAAAQLAAAAGATPLADTVSQLLSTDFALAATDLLDAAENPQARWQLLRELLPALDRLRLADHRAQILALERRRADRLDAQAHNADADAARRATLLSAAQDHLISELFASPDPSLKALAVSLSEAILATDPQASTPPTPRATAAPALGPVRSSSLGGAGGSARRDPGAPPAPSPPRPNPNPHPTRLTRINPD